MSVASNLEILEFKAGETIIRQGDKSDKAYMILSGSVRVFLSQDGKVVDLAELGEDEIFGESAIFTGENYGANVSALTSCELYVLTPNSINTMLESTDPIIRAILHMSLKRLKATNEALLKSETRSFIDVGMI